MENGTSSSDGGPEAEHPLQQPWQLYLHYPTITTITQSLESYGKEAYQALCEFSTVEGFWAYFHFLPRPSDIFTEVVAGSYPPQLLKRKLDGKNLEAFGLFKKGVKPEWEDPLNMQGGHWECRREPAFDLSTLDKMWRTTVMALIGETLEDGSAITGARVVDKSRNKRLEYRLEIWTAVKEESVNEGIRTKLIEALKEGLGEGGRDGGRIPEFVWKEHSQIVNTGVEGYGGSTASLSVSAGAGGGGGGGGGGKAGGLGAASASIRDKVLGALSS